MRSLPAIDRKFAEVENVRLKAVRPEPAVVPLVTDTQAPTQTGHTVTEKTAEGQPMSPCTAGSSMEPRIALGPSTDMGWT